MGRKKEIAKPYRVVLEASHMPAGGVELADRFRSVKFARKVAVEMAMHMALCIHGGSAAGVTWARSRLYCGPHLMATFEPPLVD